MGVASAGSERRIDESASLHVPVCLRMPSRQLSRPFTIKNKDVSGLLGLWTRVGVFVGGDALSNGQMVLTILLCNRPAPKRAEVWVVLIASQAPSLHM